MLATKAGSRAGTRAASRRLARAPARALDASLRRLGVDHVDLWQLHAWDPTTPLEETLSALDTAVASGRARYVGISNYAGWQTAQAATWQRAGPGRPRWSSTQMEYSLLQRGDRARGRRRRREALGLGILPWSPLGRGVLTGKYRNGMPADSRAASPHFAPFVAPFLGDPSRRVVDAVCTAASVSPRWRA